MKKTLIGFLLLTFAVTAEISAAAQQIPFLSELFSRYEEFNRLYTQKRRAGANLSAVEPLRKRGEEAFKRGDIPAILEAIGEAQTLLAGRKWDERQKFIASLTLEVDRLVIEPNQVVQVSLTRMFPAGIDKAFTSAPTVTFMIVSGEAAAGAGEARPAKPLPEPLIIAQRLTIAETSSNATRRLLLPDGAYEVVAVIETAGQKIAEIKRLYYQTTRQSITADFAKALQILKSMSDEDERERAAVYMDGLSQMRSDWSRRDKKKLGSKK